MRVTETEIPDVLLVTPTVHRDARGWLMESFHAERLAAFGIPRSFAQENRTLSQQGVLRGLHFQARQSQGKFVEVVTGAIYDVAVDMRDGSPTRGRWVGLELSADPPRSLWIPPGFAHGFYVMQGPAVVTYKLTAPYAPEWDRCLAWDDPTVGVRWPLQGPPLLSERDRQGQAWSQLESAR